MGVEKKKRLYYLLWEEEKSPRVVLEITSKSTRKEDQETKFRIYRDVLRVEEYFLFDPFEDYLTPSMQGFRLSGADYGTIEMIDHRLPSQVLGLHLERDGDQLRFFDPAAGTQLPTHGERRREAELERERAEIALHQAEMENQRLRRELEEAKRRGT